MGPGLSFPREAGDRGALPAEVDPVTPHAGGPAEPTSPRLAAPGKCSLPGAAEAPPGSAAGGPSPRASGAGGRSRGQVERRPGSQRRKVCVQFRP